MTKDLFQFWAEMPDDAKIHPADKDVFERVGNHAFSPHCLPGAYRGSLKAAKVVLLFLSPGLDPDDPRHCASEQGRQYYAKQRTGECNLPDKEDHPSAHRWLSRIISQFGITYEQARPTLATLNIGAYKSEKFNDWSMLAALPSSRVCLDWAQSILFPQAVRGERVVVCLRSHRYWGLGIGEPIGVSLFRPECNPAAFMHNGEMRDNIVSAVRAAIQKSIPVQKSST